MASNGSSYTLQRGLPDAGSVSAADEAEFSFTGCTLSVMNLGADVPGLGYSFYLLCAEALQGSFSTLNMASVPTGLVWRLSYLNDVVGGSLPRRQSRGIETPLLLQPSPGARSLPPCSGLRAR